MCPIRVWFPAQWAPQTGIQTSLESTATGQVQRCFFTLTSDPPGCPLLTMTTLATGSEGRFLSVYRGQLSALNQVPLAFKKPAFHFSSQIGCSTSPHTAAPGGPYPRSLPRLPDHTSTYRHTSSLNRDSQRHVCDGVAN